VARNNWGEIAPYFGSLVKHFRRDIVGIFAHGCDAPTMQAGYVIVFI
jgi:hypothetical protein